MQRWLHVEDRHPMPLMPRPVVFIEDELSPVFKLLEALADKETFAGEVLGACTVMLLAPPGEDTRRDIIHLLCKYPELQIAALPCEPRLSVNLKRACESLRAKSPFPDDDVGNSLEANRTLKGATTADTRYADLERALLYESQSFTLAVNFLIRPGGMVVCDLQLKTLQRTLENQDQNEADWLLRGAVAAGIACDDQGKAEPGMLVQQPARLSVLSGMERFLSVTCELEERNVTIDGKLVFLKRLHFGKMAYVVGQMLRTRFPWHLTVRHPKRPVVEKHRVGSEDIPIIDASMDLVLWPCLANGRASGRAFEPEGYTYTAVPAAALKQLVDGHLARPRRAVLKTDIKTDGQTPENVIGTIRKRACKPVIPEAFEGMYQLRPELAVGRCDLRE